LPPPSWGWTSNNPAAFNAGVWSFAGAAKPKPMARNCIAPGGLSNDNLDRALVRVPEWGSPIMSFPLPWSFRRQFPAPSLIAFVALQVLDILTTLIGMAMGAQEGSMFLGRLMRAGPVAALLISKILAVFLVAVALRFKRPRIVVFLNFWFAAVVTWNLAIILTTLVTIRHHR
jgi:hypothetical protein